MIGICSPNVHILFEHYPEKRLVIHKEYSKDKACNMFLCYA